MIEIKNLTKRFQDFTALENVTCTIGSGCIYGMVGSNGAGKSTFLRTLTGVYQPDGGEIRIDGEPVWDNPAVKRRIAYVPDELYFLAGANLNRMERMYRNLYPDFDRDRFEKLRSHLQLPRNKSLGQFSKGMRRQAATILALSCRPDYLFFDETFDGLDPVMRQTVKSLFANDIEERNLTPVIASHNLRELEDICDHVGLLHKGGILLSKDLDDMKLNIHKIQCVLPAGVGSSDLQGIDIIKTEQRGSLLTLTVRGKREEIQTILQAYHPVFFEMIPLSLEEIFISETEVAGYDIKRLVF